MASTDPAVDYIEGREGFSRFQVVAITLCALVNVVDGFDVLAIAFTAPAISTEWSLSPGGLGVVFSAGYLGMALGAFFLGALADKFGRRRMILSCLAVLTVTMGLTSTAGSVAELLSYRFASGLAIGAMLASITAITAEYSPDSKRNFMISIVQGMYAIGATLGGAVSAYLVGDFGWRSVFLVGATVNGALLLAAFFLLPESLAYLLKSHSKNALDRANAIIRQLGGAPLDKLPQTSGEQASGQGFKRLLDPDFKKWSVLLWISTFTAMFGTYFLMSWIPKIVVDAGVPFEKAAWVGMSINAGGLVGILWLGYRSAVSGLREMITVFMFMAGCLMIVFGQLSDYVPTLIAVAVAMGFFGQAGFIGLYSVAARLYPTDIRATGIGCAIGLGRVGAIVGPAVAGILIGLEWSRPAYFLTLSVPFFIGAMAVWQLKARQLKV